MFLQDEASVELGGGLLAAVVALQHVLQTDCLIVVKVSAQRGEHRVRPSVESLVLHLVSRALFRHYVALLVNTNGRVT